MYFEDSSSSGFSDSDSGGGDSTMSAEESGRSTHYTFTHSTLHGRRHREDRFLDVEIQRQPWGSLAVREPSRPIRGITGAMQYVGRHRGSWSHLTTVVFFLHTSQSIFSPTESHKTEALPLSSLFWLAHGFVPSDRNGAEGCKVVFCIESPDDGLGRCRAKVRDGKEKAIFFGLRESGPLDVPMSITNSVRCLGIPAVCIRYFALTDSTKQPKDIKKYMQRIRAVDKRRNQRLEKMSGLLPPPRL